jgi:hypothetical protein
MKKENKIFMAEMNGGDVFHPRYTTVGVSGELEMNLVDEKDGASYTPCGANAPYTDTIQTYHILMRKWLVGIMIRHVYWHGGVESGHTVEDDRLFLPSEVILQHMDTDEDGNRYYEAVI